MQVLVLTDPPLPYTGVYDETGKYIVNTTASGLMYKH